MTTLTPTPPPSPSPPIRRRRRPWLLLGIVALAGIAFVLVWFQPYKLFLDDKVDDAFPVAASPATDQEETEATAATADPAAPVDDGAVAVPPPAPADPVALATGSFRSLDHDTSGQATVFELADGSRVLRLEGFETDNGPDLRVYLSTATADADEDAFDEDFVDLGALRGNIGNQNYELPADVELDQFQSVVIWCRRFTSGFGVSPLT